jgi:hypothetical protein
VNSRTAAELKRRGMTAIEEELRRGRVRLLKRNKATAVVVSAEEHSRLSPDKHSKQSGMTALQWLMARTAAGRKTKKRLDTSLHKERASWR